LRSERKTKPYHHPRRQKLLNHHLQRGYIQRRHKGNHKGILKGRVTISCCLGAGDPSDDGAADKRDIEGTLKKKGML